LHRGNCSFRPAKSKALACILEIQFELVHDLSEQAAIEKLLEGMWANSSSPHASQLKFTNAAEVEEAILGRKAGKHETQTSYRTDTFGTMFEKILLTRTLSEVSGRGVLRNKQFGLRPKRSNALELAFSFKGCLGTVTRS